MIPGPWEGLVLALAVYRIWRAIAEDDLPPFRPMHNWLGTGRHNGLQKWLYCPFCSPPYIALALLVAWWIDSTAAMYFAAPWALFAGVSLIATKLDN